MTSGARDHRWRFFRAGDFDQVRLDRQDDLLALEHLDQKLWVALACPTSGIEFDRETLKLIDTDKDDRIRAPELLAAVRWTSSVLKDLSSLSRASSTLPLSLVDDSSELGRQLLASARQILRDLGKPDAQEISVDDTADTTRIFSQTRFNGDGIIPASSASDEATAKVITEMLTCVGSETDRSGQPGVNQEKVDRFFAEATSLVDWWKLSETSAETLLPLQAETPAASEALRAIQTKVDDYFARCRLAAFDARATAHLNRDEAAYAAIAARTLSSTAEDVAAFPLARIEAGKPLPLDRGVNPAWTDAAKKLRSAVIAPLLGDRDSLTETEWEAITARLAPHAAWQASKPTSSVETLGLPRLRELLDRNAKAAIDALLVQDRELEGVASAILSVDRLVRYHRHLYTLINNFVSFSQFYSRKKAIFQVGTLFLDGRSFDLCVKVADAGAHAAAAANSAVYLAYCDVTRKATGEKMTIAAAITDGDAENLFVGRNGLFYDRQGNDWDATIVKLVDQPISIRQAFWMPYKRLGKLIGDQINKFAAAREKAASERTAAGVDSSVKAVDSQARATPTDKPPPPPFDIARFAGIFAGIGIALGAIGSVLMAIATGFLSLKLWQMPLAIAVVILLISLPSMFLAYLKLRGRNLGPILDANGWAVNARARINVPFGRSFTSLARLPRHSERSLSDPYAEKSTPWGLYLFLLLAAAGLLAWKLGYAQAWWLDLKAASSPPAASSSAPLRRPPAHPGHGRRGLSASCDLDQPTPALFHPGAEEEAGLRL